MMSRSFLTHRANLAVAQIRKSNLQISPLQSARGDDCDLQTAESTMFYRRSIFTSMAFLMGQVIGFERAKAGETPFWRTQSGAERVVALEEAGQIIANGVVWDDEGHIVSSYITFKEILRKNSELKASSKGLTGTLEVVGFDPTLDIIVFLCDKSFVDEPLRLVTKGYRVGTSVISLVRDGESEDGFFVGKGILSGLGRTIIAANGVKMPDLLQTDAPVSIMSAGSGLFQPDGALLGIFTPGNIPFAKFRSDSGVNFIIPGSTLKTVVPRLLKHG